MRMLSTKLFDRLCDSCKEFRHVFKPRPRVFRRSKIQRITRRYTHLAIRAIFRRGIRDCSHRSLGISQLIQVDIEAIRVSCFRCVDRGRNSHSLAIKGQTGKNPTLLNKVESLVRIRENHTKVFDNSWDEAFGLCPKDTDKKLHATRYISGAQIWDWLHRIMEGSLSNTVPCYITESTR